jgi:acyl-CoA thioesterase
MSTGTATWTFDRLTAVEDDVLGPQRATIPAGLTGFGGAHGGYLAALAVRAAAGVVGDAGRAPRSLTIHLLAPAQPGAVDLPARVDRAGRSMSSASVRLEQNGAPVALALASFGRRHASLERVDVAMPAVPGPDDAEPLFARPVPEAGASLLVEHRPARDPLPLRGGDRAELVVWMSLVERRPVDPVAAVFLADSAAPALYGALDAYVPMPSSDITLHLASFPDSVASPWVLGVVRSTLVQDGYAVEDGELWSPGGRLLVQSRQLRRVLRPA